MAPRRFFVSSDDGWQLTVFILEDVLSVKMDNASMVVFILGTHYPPGRTLVRLVMRLKHKDGQKTHYVSGRSFQFEIRLERRTMEVVRLEA